MSSPESWTNSGPMAWRCCETRPMFAVASFTPTMFLQLEEPRHRRDRHVDDRARRDVVDDDRDADRVVHRLEVLVEPFLGRLVVVGRDDEKRVGARLLGVLGELDRLGRVVGAGAGDHRHAPLRLIDARSPRRSCARHGTRSDSRRSCRPARALACRSRSASSTWARKASSSSAPSRNGVTSAVSEPRNRRW